MTNANAPEQASAPLPPPASPPVRGRMRRRLRFSLRTMLFFALLAGSPVIIYANREPWIPGPILRGHTDGLHAAVFSPDGKKVLTAARDGTVREWDASSGDELRVYKGHERAVYTANYSPDGTRIVSGGLDRALVVWDAETGKEVTRNEGHDAHILSAVYAPDGKRIAYGMFDGSARVVDAQTFELVGELKGHMRSVECVTYSPDGKYIATAGGDFTIRLWDALTMNLQGELRDHGDIIHDVRFSPDMKWLVSASKDGRCIFRGLGRTADDEVISSAFTMGFESESYKMAAITSLDILTQEGVGRLAFAAGNENAIVIMHQPLFGKPREFDNVVISAGDEGINSVRFSPYGKKIVLASLDKTARIYVRRRPEWWWGYFWLPQTWLAIVLLGCFAWSLRKDQRELKTN